MRLQGNLCGAVQDLEISLGTSRKLQLEVCSVYEQ